MNTSKACLIGSIVRRCAGLACAVFALSFSNVLAQSSRANQKPVPDLLARSASDEAAGGARIKTPASVNSNPDNAELLKELQQMRARIEELENRLMGQNGAAESSSQQPAAIQNVSLNAADKPSSTQAPDSTQGKKP